VENYGERLLFCLWGGMKAFSYMLLYSGWLLFLCGRLQCLELGRSPAGKRGGRYRRGRQHPALYRLRCGRGEPRAAVSCIYSF
jgi:hypothetical protein